MKARDYSKACQAIGCAIDCTSWHMPHDWKEALRLERSQSHCGNLSDAKRLCAREWLAGYEAPHTSAVEVYQRRPGARLAFLLGAECSRRAMGHNGPLIEQAAQSCRDAIAQEESSK